MHAAVCASSWLALNQNSSPPDHASLGDILVALFAWLSPLETVQVVLVDEVLDVALHERRLNLEQMPQLFLDLVVVARIEPQQQKERV